MKFKVYFLSNARSIVEADNYAVDDKLLVFIKDDKPVLTYVFDEHHMFLRRR